MNLFVNYPKCGTCRKAAQWLKDHGIEFESRDIVVDNPTESEILEWSSLTPHQLPKLFNTSGLKYKALKLKDVVYVAPQERLVELLASDGMLVKRPVLVTPNRVLFGFKEDEWTELLLK